MRPVRFLGWSLLLIGVVSAVRAIQPYTLRVLVPNPNEALVHAVQKHDTGSVAVALNCGADPNVVTGSVRGGMAHGGHVLTYAAAHGDTEIVRLLLNHGANPNINNGTERITPLSAATEWKYPAIIALLRRHGATR